MSGMGKIKSAQKSRLFNYNIIDKTSYLLVISYKLIATLSNCGELLKVFVLSHISNYMMAQRSKLRYSNNQTYIWKSAQASSDLYQNELQRLNGCGEIVISLRYSLNRTQILRKKRYTWDWLTVIKIELCSFYIVRSIFIPVLQNKKYKNKNIHYITFYLNYK